MTTTKGMTTAQILDDEKLRTVAGGNWESIFGDIVSWLPGGIACAEPAGATGTDAHRFGPCPNPNVHMDGQR